MGAHMAGRQWMAGAAALAVMLSVLVATGAVADPVVAEGPFLVTESEHAPRDARVAHNPDRGEYLVAYMLSGAGAPDGPHVVRVDGAGVALGAPVALHPEPSGSNQKHVVSVVHNPGNGEYFVVWTERRGDNTDGGRDGFVAAQRLSATGELIGGNITIAGPVGNTYFCGYTHADAAPNPATGGYMVSARLGYQTSTEGADCGGLDPATSRAEVFSVNAAGSVLATNVVPGSLREAAPSRTNISGNPETGEFLVVYSRSNTAGPESDNSATLAHRVSPAGEPVGSVITITEPTGNAGGADGFAAGDPVTGNWLVVSHGGGMRNHARLLSPDGASLGVSERFGGGNHVRYVVATGDGRWVAMDERGGATEFGSDGQAIATAAVTGGTQRSVALAVADGSDPVRMLGVWAELNPRRVDGAFVELVAPEPDGPPVQPGVRRLSGNGRLQTAVAISAATFDPGVAVAYIATAGGFPDALAAGPLAAVQGGPILLTGRDSLDDSTRGELQRLAPGRIAVLGGAGAVSDAVVQELRGFTSGQVTRLSGPDRYQTAARVVDQFPPNTDIVLVATGEAFPDALAGGAAAGLTSSPIVLVAKASVPAASRTALERLAPRQILVLGGAGAVSAEVFNELQSLASEGAQRLSGTDRFATAAQISARFTAPLDTVVVGTGANFPDALAGTPAAVLRGAPILLVTGTSIPAPIAAELDRLAPREILVLGGAGAVNDDVVNQLRTYLRSG